MTSGKLEVGSRAPDFTLRDQDDALVHLADRIGKQVIVLYFYPKDDTPGCTMEACGFRDSYESFCDAGAEVIGVSGGSTETKQHFAERNHLPFTLVTDADGAVAQAYGVGKVFGLFTQRITFVIDRAGIIRQRFESNINMDRHVQEALRVVQSLVDEPAL